MALPAGTIGGRQRGPFAQAGAFGVSVDWNPALHLIVQDFVELGIRLQSFREPLKRAVQQVAIPSIRKNFDEEGRPSWERLAPHTIAKRLGTTNEDALSGGHGGLSVLYRPAGENRKNAGGTHLRTGATQLRIWKITRTEAEVTDLPPEVWYGKPLQKGFTGGDGADVPARPFMLFQDEDLDKIDEVFERWIDERVSAVGFRG